MPKVAIETKNYEPNNFSFTANWFFIVRRYFYNFIIHNKENLVLRHYTLHLTIIINRLSLSTRNS